MTASTEYLKNNTSEIIYCGGRFDFDCRDKMYAEKAILDYRAVLLKDVNLLLNSRCPVPLCPQTTYIGPFYFETVEMHDQDIVEAEKKQIEKCTLALFLLDDRPCPGTIAEMVYAAMLQKKMAVIYLKDEAETESALLTSCWYPIILCQKINHSRIDLIPYSGYSNGRDMILKYIQDNVNYP